jgi:molecular chaperone DnaJ
MTMPTLPEYYRILGISPQAGLAEVKQRFRRLALRFHPDRNPRNPNAADHFREVADAYNAICDRRSRQPIPPQDHSEQKPKDFANKVFMRQKLDDFFGNNTFSARLPSFCGPDFRYDLQIPFLAALWGLEKHIEIKRLMPCQTCRATGMQPGSYYRDCPVCKGQGRRRTSPGQLRIGAFCDNCQGHGKIMSKPCLHCGGQGTLWQLKKYKVVIPPGIADGSRIFLNGEGGEGFQEGPPGHLVVVVHVEAHNFFTRHNQDLHVTLDISFAQAVLGDCIPIPTPFGTEILDLPRGTRSGQNFIFPGLGVPAAGHNPSGNLIVKVQISNKTRFGEQDISEYFSATRTESK